MSFYNDFRPHDFQGIVGQEQVTTVLKQQAATHHFHHAYFLFGPSGSGKTTCARVLAAALNCDAVNGNGEPCGKCQSCQAIMENRHWDVQEIDGARFRGIDDVKDLCYKAYFSPLGKHKVYIIDECHQLTDPAWAALLKLIEEPPPHLVVILCTTEYGKVPDTIVSRCQQYPFLKLQPELIKNRLLQVCRTKGIQANPEHLDRISHNSNGNMRSSLNTLEQVYVLSQSTIPLV